MRSLRWDRIGLVVLNLTLIILAAVQANWFALTALVVVSIQMQLLFTLIGMAGHMKRLLGIASEIITGIHEEHSNGDTKN